MLTVSKNISCYGNFVLYEPSRTNGAARNNHGLNRVHTYEVLFASCSIFGKATY